MSKHDLAMRHSAMRAIASLGYRGHPLTRQEIYDEMLKIAGVPAWWWLVPRWVQFVWAAWRVAQWAAELLRGVSDGSEASITEYSNNVRAATRRGEF